MAEDRPRAGQKPPDRDEPDGGRAQAAQPSDYPRRATMRGIAAPTLHLGPLRMVPASPDSSGSTTFQAVEDIRDVRDRGTSADRASLYDVDENEPTLFEVRPDFYPTQDAAPPRNERGSHATQLVLRQPAPVHTAVAAPQAPPPHAYAPRRGPLDRRLILLLEPDSQRAASFRLLRDNLFAAKAPRILAVTSGAPNEGKTTCAVNLALALAERPAARVLLLEGNFFGPSLGQIFSIDAGTPAALHMNLPWLLPYRIAEIMRGLHVAAVVRPPGTPVPVFNSRWFDMVIGHLAGAEYDHLVIDAAALDGSPAVAQIVAAAEGTLFTVRTGKTTARSYRQAAEQIPQGRGLGVVMMDDAS